MNYYELLREMVTIVIINLDAAVPWQMGFQDPATPVMEGIINFHHDLLFFLILIVISVTWVLIRCIFFFNENINKKAETFVHGTILEIVWTITPAIILIIIAIPSFSLLYAMDEVIDPILTLKVIGNQWYWSYEYSDVIDESIFFDSYMVLEEVRVIITATDVLHCWAIPSLGIKLDACPGRLNQTSMYIKREGVFYGQCSEICGINHGFMPIVVEVVSLDDYITWFNKKIELN